jgi:hypothetical protein
LKHSDFRTVPATALLSVRDSELGTKLFQNLKSAAAHYYTQYYTGPSERVLLLCGQEADILPTQTSGVVLSVW